ncbi:serine hydrolase [bacterium]|nr:serine hydrolase [bacterium]
MKLMSRYIQMSLLCILACLVLACNKSNPVESESIYPAAEAQNMDVERLTAVVSTFSGMPHIRCFLVSRNGETVVEEYFNGYSASSTYDVRSVTKSISSLLIGIAIDKGDIPGVHTPIGTYLDSFTENLDSTHSALTIENLLTMSSGIDWDEDITSEYIPWIYAENQIDFVLEKDIIHTPGTRFVYNSGASHLLSPIIFSATGECLYDYAVENLFSPLGIGDRQWKTVSQGHNSGSAGLYLSGRDMIKIGELYLNNGLYEEKRIVSQDWINASTSTRISTRGTGPFGPGYGYLFWTGSKDGHDYFFANGYGGQFIVVVPDLSLVIVSQCEWRISGSQAGNNWYNIISNIINEVIPAAH